MNRIKRYITKAQKELEQSIHTMDERQPETNLKILDKLEEALQKDLAKFKAKLSKAIGRQKQDPIRKRIFSLKTDLRLILGHRHIEKERLEKNQLDSKERSWMKSRERRKWQYTVAYHSVNDDVEIQLSEVIESLRKLGIYYFSAKVERTFGRKKQF